MTDKQIQKLIDQYLEGTTSPQEEHRLAEALLRPDIPEEWQTVRMMLGELAMGEAVYDHIMAERHPQTAHMWWRWLVVAASVIVLLGIGSFLLFFQDRPTPKESKMAKVETKTDEHSQDTNQPKIEEDTAVMEHIPENNIHNNTATVGEQPKPKYKPVQKQTANFPPVAEEQEPEEEQPTDYRPLPAEESVVHYASHETTEDSTYQDPARVDEFIAKLADYHGLPSDELERCDDKDNITISSAYVFPDSKEVDVFGRLLQVACHYSDDTPGYLLNFSHQQFYFQLKDQRKQLRYIWIAERLNGKILVYSTHAPISATMSSACFQEYRAQLTHTKM